VSEPAEAHLPLGRAAECSRQLEGAIGFICDHHALPRVSLIAHFWGSIVAGGLAGRCPELIERLVFFGPIARRDAQGERQRLDGWRLVSDHYPESVVISTPSAASENTGKARPRAVTAKDNYEQTSMPTESPRTVSGRPRSHVRVPTRHMV
jgi:pimeloyl-ACP methyl ester carboxylesterase